MPLAAKERSYRDMIDRLQKIEAEVDTELLAENSNKSRPTDAGLVYMLTCVRKDVAQARVNLEMIIADRYPPKGGY